MQARVKWAGAARFDGTSESGHTVVMDGAPEFGGENQGPRPMEMLLLGMGGCTAFDVVLILKKSRQAVEDCEVLIDAKRAGTEPKGKNMSEERVKRAIELSAEKYCSASIMLAKTANITHDFEIIET